MSERMHWPTQIEWIENAEPLVSKDVLFPFALDEVLCRRFHKGGLPALHSWAHGNALVLGLRDRRLPLADRAIELLRAQGTDVIVRNSGGTAVPLDFGVVNLSLILPTPERSLNFHEDFQYMAAIVNNASSLWTGTVQAGEVDGAYCPGDFDLSVRGRKICGISQRRQRHGFAVQAFVNVEGSGEQRANKAATYYTLASGGQEGLLFPRVEARKTASIVELARAETGTSQVTTNSFINEVKYFLQNQGIQLTSRDVTTLDLEEVWHTVEQLRTRYDR